MTSNVSNLLANIGTGKAISILELASIIIKISDIKSKPIFKEELEGDIKKSQADMTLANNSLIWKPKKELRNWLEEILKK